MIRIPEPGRFELLADGAPIHISCRPHCWRRGLTASRTNATRVSVDINMYTEGTRQKMPRNRPKPADALRALEKSSVFKAALEDVLSSYVKLKYDWNGARVTHQPERQNRWFDAFAGGFESAWNAVNGKG
jgi:hypothetical protein